MKNLEERMQDEVKKYLESGEVEKKLNYHLEKAFDEAFKDLVSWGSPLRKKITQQLNEVMSPLIENYDYSKFVTKMDYVLTEILKETFKPSNELFENFVKASEKQKEEVHIKEILKEYVKFKESEMDPNDLDDLDFEEGYEDIECCIRVENTGYFSNRESLILENEAEEEEHIELLLFKDYKGGYKIFSTKSIEIKSLRYMNSFDLYILALQSQGTKIIWDSESEYSIIEVNKYE